MSEAEADAPERARPVKEACDLCRTRKVKCRTVQDNASCDACQALDLPCTRLKPRRRRGPTARYQSLDLPTPAQEHLNSSTGSASAYSPPSLVGPGGQSASNILSPAVSNVSASQSARTNSVYSIVSLVGPLDLVLSILDDWFKISSPLCPLLHRQHLLQRLEDQGTAENPVFAALVVSLCAMTIATLRRKTFEKYPGVTISQCLEIIKNKGLLQSDYITVESCISWYFIATAALVDHGLGNFPMYRAIRESMTGVDWLLGHRGSERTMQEREILKRLYWLLYMWQVTSEVLGQPHLTFVSFPQKTDHLRPLELSDSQLYPEVVPRAGSPSWPEDDYHYIPGLNRVIDLFLVWEQVKIDMTHKMPETTLGRAMDRIHAILDDLPPNLRWRGGLRSYPAAIWGHEIQVVNIWLTALSLKSSILQYVGVLVPGLTQYDIACDVLEVLKHLPQPVFEANGYAVVLKIRDIGAAYLAELDSGGFAADRASHENLQLLLKTLENLDFTPVANDASWRGEA